MPNTMHSFDNGSSNVPAFLVKLWKLVEDPTCDELIAWSDSGYSFVIKDQAKFAKELLPQYFKHNNMASFIRQLNMYGFKKVMNIEKSGLRNENDEMEFQNAFFMKEKAELLELIKRKIPNTRVVAAPEPSPKPNGNAKEILIDLTTIREKQENMDNMLLKMKKENELLWRELTSMRQKHKAQEQIIQKVIQFLVSIVQRSNQNIGVQRKISRMIHNSPASKASSSQVSRTIEVLRKNNSDCIIVPEANLSPLGPVIHEVTDGDHEDTQNLTSRFLNSPGDQADSSNRKENKSPEITVPVSPESQIEPLSILEALTPRTTYLDSHGSDIDESILGVPLDYITVNSNGDTTDVISLPDSGTICNVISIPEDGSSFISIPDSSINNISIAGVDNTIGNVISLTSNGTAVSSTNSKVDSKAAKSPVPDPGESYAIPDSDSIPHMDYFNDIAALGDLPSTSYSLSKEDFDDQLMSSVSLNTPKILFGDEDTSLSLKDKRQTKKSGQLTPKKNTTHDEHNYQLTTKDSSLAKNVLSNHLLTVDEKLNFTQDRLSSNPWNMDVQSLLGVCGLQNCWTSLDPQLFSTDEILNSESFTNPLPDDMNIKTEPNDIVGNELVQFIPNMMDMDLGNTPLFEALNDATDAEVPSGDQVNFHCHPESLLQEVLNETSKSEAVDETTASQAADFLNNEILMDNNLAKRKKSKLSRGKRRKVK